MDGKSESKLQDQASNHFESLLNNAYAEVFVEKMFDVLLDGRESATTK